MGIEKEEFHDFITAFMEKYREEEEKDKKEFRDFITAFMEKYSNEEKDLPYHINIIDELHASENAHSRILEKLLKQKTPNDEFEILGSFVQYLKEKSDSYGNISVGKKPEITQETGRIDLCIKEKNKYAIIIENKINWAPDQDKQLARYIDILIKENFKPEKIYVIYLPPTYDKKPENQTWINEKGEDYYEGEFKFKDRYLHLSFRDDILSWLTKNVSPAFKEKGGFLSSALEQYIDHLQGKFDLRNINNRMNMNMQKFIKEELGLNESPYKNIVKLSEIKEKINKQFQSLEDNLIEDMSQEWEEHLKKKYTGYETVSKTCFAGLIIPIKDTKKVTKVQVILCYDRQKEGNFYCQVDTFNLLPKETPIPQNVIKKLYPDILPFVPDKGNYGGQIWQWFNEDDSDKPFAFMCKVIDILINE